MKGLDSTRAAFEREKARALVGWCEKNFISIAKLNLETGAALLLKSEGDPDSVGEPLPWEELIERFALRRAYRGDRNKVLSLTLGHMQETLRKNPVWTTELRCISPTEDYEWVETAFHPLGGDEWIVTTRRFGNERLLRRIVDLFVYRNFDYFILLDTKRNTYITCGGNASGSPVPPASGDDYTAEMIRYNQKYVVPEDRARVIESMQIPRILAELGQSETYTVYTGGLRWDGGYRRTVLQFTYYDKSAGLVLLTRNDVTQIYLEEQEKNERMARAMRAARHDAMTGLYNQKATVDLVTQLLEKQYRSFAALLFIDVDNFKLVNDTLGHQKGDELLCALANFVQRIADKSGIAGRIGGDEFLLFLPTAYSLEDIEQRAGEICRMFGQYHDRTLAGLPISCSVGIALYPQDGTDYDTLLRKADQALYTAKRYGKNRHAFYMRPAQAAPDGAQ